MAKKLKPTPADKIWGLTRIGLGFILLFAFMDKLIGLGFTTCRDGDTGAIDVLCQSAWMNGGSPTTGFLQFGTSGPLADTYQAMAGIPVVDWLFMLGLLGVGAALILGIGMRIATVSGVVIFTMMYTATLPPTNNPLLSDHVIYSLVLIGLLLQNQTQQFGLGPRWAKTKLVKRYPILT